MKELNERPRWTYIYLKIRKLQFCRVRGESDCTHSVTADQLHCKPKFNYQFWGGGVQLHSQSLQINFTATQVQLPIPGGGGGLTVLTAKLDCSHCRSTSLQPKFNYQFQEGSDCTHCKVGLHSLQINFTAAQVQLGGGSNCTHCKVGLQSLQINFTATQVQLPILGGGGLTALTQSLQINFTAAQVQLPILGGVQLQSL